MRTAKQWFEDYAVSHKNQTNINIHYICVPLIFFSVVGLLMSIPTELLNSITPIDNPLIVNWAFIAAIFTLYFYFNLGFSYGLKMLAFMALALLLNYYLSEFVNLFYTSIFIFVIAWVGQFYGHKIEGKKPSFLKDLQFLLIGPLWVIEKLTHK